VGLAYNQKFDGFFELIGASDFVLDVSRFVKERQVDELEALVEAALRNGTGRDERIDLLKNQVQQFTHDLVVVPASSSSTATPTRRAG
jgi:hypothetical protein